MSFDDPLLQKFIYQAWHKYTRNVHLTCMIIFIATAWITSITANVTIEEKRPVQCQNAVEQHDRTKHGSLRLDSGNGGVRNTGRFLVGSGHSRSLGLIQLHEDQDTTKTTARTTNATFNDE
jgi:hypothetical protein